MCETSGLSEFYLACRAGDLLSVERLLNKHSFYELNQFESNGSTALHAAAFYGHIHIVRRLVEHGAFVRTLRNKYNLTPAQETTNEDIKRLLQPDAIHQSRECFIDDDQINENNKQQITSISSTTLFSPVSSAYVDNQVQSSETTDEKQELEWLDAYNSAHRIARENHEYMRKWLTKMPLATILETIDSDYIANPNTELTEKHRSDIRRYIKLAILDDDPRFLIYAYTLQTNFYRQLNRDLAQHGSDFRFEDHDVKMYRDDKPPNGFGQYLFAAVIIHHPMFDSFYYEGTTYRGMNLNQADLDQYVPGARILTRSFLSTSKSIHPISFYLQFDTPNIIPVVCIYRTVRTSFATGLAIASLSAIPVEDEVLIFPFVAFRVVKVDFASFYFSEQGTATVMFLDQITNESIEPWPLAGLENEQVKSYVINNSLTFQEQINEIEYLEKETIVLLYKQHEQITNEYIQFHLSLHSYLSCLDSLDIDVDQNNYFNQLFTNPLLTFSSKELEWLRSSTNMRNLSIPLEPATRSLIDISSDKINAIDIHIDFDESTKIVCSDIEEIMHHQRCCVIFGGIGIGKTTLAHWIILKNAQKFNQFLNNNLSTDINDVRLPILVCLNEIDQLLELEPNWTLFDCLCQMDYLKKNVINEDEAQQTFISDYINRQRSLIILDGLDEIIDISARNRIIDLIHHFIQRYVLNTKTNFRQNITMTSSDECKSEEVNGNQLVIFTRWFPELNYSPLAQIPSFSLKPLSFDEATVFIDRYFRQISKQFSSETSPKNLSEIELNINNWNEKAQELKRMLSMHRELKQLTGNSTLLAAICGLVTVRTLINPFLGINQRIMFYQFTCGLVLHREWKKFKDCSALTNKCCERLLIDLAAYINQYVSSGLIEEFDMRLKCRSSLKSSQEEKENTCLNRQVMSDWIRRVSTNQMGVMIPRGSDLYSFSFPAFQYYFTCLSLIKTITINDNHQTSLIESTVSQVLYHITNSLYREPLLLLLSYITWQWKPSDIELFFNQLLSVDAVRFNQQLPLAAMLVMTALSELYSIPPMDTIYTAFNQFIAASTARGWLTRFPLFIEHFLTSLNHLPPSDAALWLTNYLMHQSDARSIRAIVRVLLQFVHHTRQIPLFLRSDKDENSLIFALQNHLSIDNDHDEDEDNVFVIDRFLMTISIFQSNMLPKNTMRQYFLESNLQTEEISPSVLATIIALYGGLHRFSTDSNEQCLHETIVFSPSHMHRTSTLTELLIDCLKENRCDVLDLLHKKHCEDVSSDTVDLFVACLCLEGVAQPYVYEKFINWPAFWQAQAKLRRLALYLSEYYYTRVDLNCCSEPHSLSSSLFRDANQIIAEYISSLSHDHGSIGRDQDLFSFIESIASAICRLIYPGGERSIFVCNPDPIVGMLNLPLSDEFEQLLMSTEYSSKTFSERLTNLIQLTSPPFLPKHLHVDIDDLAERQTFEYEIHPMLSYRHHSSFPLAILPQTFQSLFTYILDSSSNMTSNDKHAVLLMGEVARTLSRRREGTARYNLLLAILRSHFEEHQLANCYTGLVYMTVSPGLRSFFLPFDSHLSTQDQRPLFNLILDEEERDEFLLYTALIEQIQRVQEAQYEQHETGTTNLKLYTSAISLAALIAALDQRRKDERRLIVNDNEAIETALLINDPILRLHALTIIWQFEQTMHELIERKWILPIALDTVSSAANNLEMTLEFHTLLFLMFWSTFASLVPIDQSKQELVRLLDRLESQANSTSTNLEQIICKTLLISFDHAEFPFLHQRIYQFIKHSQWSKEPKIVSWVLGFRSPSLLDCMERWFNLQATASTTTCFASMYLMQLSIDANMLPIWLKQETIRKTRQDQSKDIEKEIVLLFDMSSQPEILTLDIVIKIDQLLYENTSETSTNFPLLEQRLTQCTFVESSALAMVANWCQFRTSTCSRRFAYCAALLTVQRYPTNTALEICYDLLQIDDDDFRMYAYKIITTIYQSSTRLGRQGFIDFFKLVLSSHHSHSVLIYETISKIDLRIDSVETLELLLRWERQRIRSFISTLTCQFIDLEYGLRLQGNNSNVSFLQMTSITFLVPDIKNLFFTHACTECHKTLAMLGHIEDQEQQLYLRELVLYVSCLWSNDSPEKMSTEEDDFIDALIKLLTTQNPQIRPILAEVIIQALIVNRPHLPYVPRGTSRVARQCIRQILTQITEQLSDKSLPFSDDTIATMIKHYYHGDIRFGTDIDDDLKLLTKLQSDTLFSKRIVDAAACARIRAHCFISKLQSNFADLLQLSDGSYLRLYRTLMLLQNDSVTTEMIQLITPELIKKYEDKLLPLFVEELCEIITQFNVEFSLSLPMNNCNHLTVAMDVINKVSSARFREIVQKQIDESIFKYSLYCTSKQVHSRRRLCCLEMLTCLYGELTIEVHDMFNCAVWEKFSDRQLAYICVANIQRVANRSVVEQLFSQLMTNVSRHRRYLAGMLLVQLARCDEISTFEVQEKLSEAIDCPLTKLDNGEVDLLNENAIRTTSQQLDQALFNLLMQLSFISNHGSKQILSNNDYRLPDVTNFEEEFSRLIDADCCASCIFIPST